MGVFKLEDVNYTYDDYKLWQDGFKIESYSFDETTYKVSLDFKKVFARFRG